MTSGLTLRHRIILTFLPLLILTAALGCAGMWLLKELGGSIDVILRENYYSVVAMQDLKESLERIDSSFQFMLVARGLMDPLERQALESKARTAFAENCHRFDGALGKEQANVTIHPTEDEFVERLTELSKKYRGQGDSFFQRASSGAIQHQDYYGAGGLYETFVAIKQLADDILQLNRAK